MNNDGIIVHKEDPFEDTVSISAMDRVIIADTQDKIGILQKLLCINSNLCIYYYSESDIDLKTVYSAPNIVNFGNMRKILIEDNIINEKLYTMGKLINFDYVLSQRIREGNEEPKSFAEIEEEMKDCWFNTDGYGRESSIARADHYFIEKWLREDIKISEEELKKMEHIRWCRFLYINRFEYADERKPGLRKHHLLVDYEKIPKSEKYKDIVNTRVIRDELNEIEKIQKPKFIKFNGELVNLYKFSKEQPEYSLFVIKGMWHKATLFAAVIGLDINDDNEALKFSREDPDYDVVEKDDLNLDRVGRLLSIFLS